MHHRDRLTRMNWLYVGLVIGCSLAVLAFVAWSVTAPALRAAGAGDPMPGGWSWWSVAILDALAVGTFAGLLWKVYRDALTEIDARGISQPSLRGTRQIAWGDVRRIAVFGGVGCHVHGPRFRIVVSPYAYRSPDSVVAALQAGVSNASRPTRAC